MKIKILQIEQIQGDKAKKDNDDYIIKSIGTFGRWQLMICLIVSISRLIPMWNTISVFFLTPNTNFKCVKFQNNSLMLATLEGEISVCYENCLKYAYTQDVFERTLIAEFGLICEREWMASFVQTILMFGLVLGVSMFGWISDRFGRSKTLCLSTIINVILMFSILFSSNYWMFVTFRFLIGLASGGIMTTTTVYILETIGPEFMEIVGSLSLLTDQIAMVCLALFAYLAPTWRWYQLQYNCISVVIMIAMLFIPETPRWLIVHKKSDQAIIVMTKAAKFNGRPTNDIKDNVIKAIEALKTNDTAPTLTYLDLFRIKNMPLKTISSIVVWFVTGTCYFGINQYITLLGSNIFVVVLLLGVMQMPSVPITILLTRAFGRRTAAILSLLAVSATMAVLLFIPQNTWVSTTVGVIGACAINTTFIIIYIYVVELYPTPMRNMGFGASSAGSKVGAMVAPFIANLKPHWAASLIFSLLALVAVGFCFLLPETKGQKLKDDLD